jgi:hypothetical protein
MTYTIAEVERSQAKPENAHRVAILVREDGDEFVAEWDGREVRAGNPFGLDSRLTDIGAPQPRNLYLLAGESK